MKYFLILLVFFIISCSDPSSSKVEDDEKLYTPNKELKLSEILKEQGIQNISFSVWDSSSVNGKESYFHKSWQIDLDSLRVKRIQYYIDNEPWIITVIDLIKWNVWQYDIIYQSFESLKFPDTLVAFQSISKDYLTNSIQNTKYKSEFKYFDNKKCHVIADSLENEVWIWVKHGLPIRKLGNYVIDGIKVEYLTELRDLKVNEFLPD